MLLFHHVNQWEEEGAVRGGRHNAEVYGRCLQRVGGGRKKTRDEVHALARGHIYSGVDARSIGLVDDLGDVRRAVEIARELSGAGPDAPVWNVAPPPEMLLPSAEDPTTLVRLYGDLLRDTSLCMMPTTIHNS